MSTPAPFTKQVAVDQLAGWHTALVRTLTAAGVTGDALNDLFARHVRAQCVGCGIQLTGEEIGRLTLGDAASALDAPKLERLRLGYCARKDCTCYYYQVVCEPHPKVDWARLWSGLEGQPLPNPAEAEAAAAPAPDPLGRARRRSLVRAGIGLGVILVLLVLRHLWLGGTLPGFPRAPKYTVDPASLSEEH
jgi:hypothetical protein